MLKTAFSEVCVGAEFMLGTEDFRKEDEEKAQNVRDGLFEYFAWDAEVYVARERDAKLSMHNPGGTEQK